MPRARKPKAPRYTTRRKRDVVLRSLVRTSFREVRPTGAHQGCQEFLPAVTSSLSPNEKLMLAISGLRVYSLVNMTRHDAKTTISRDFAVVRSNESKKGKFGWHVAPPASSYFLCWGFPP